MAEVVAVAVTKQMKKLFHKLVLPALLIFCHVSSAAVLPEERSDALYHSYDGGGVTIDGPSILVRKNFAETISISANYYVDSVSSASIDVTTSGASKYTEERTEYSLGATYLIDKSLLSAGITRSDENDYQGSSAFFNVSQDIFGDLTNISFGYARGNDTVSQNGNDEFEETIDRQNYQFGLSQIVTKNLILGLNYENINDEGFLNNPYRNYRFINSDENSKKGFKLLQEVYPATRTSDALTIRAAYYLPYRAALKFEYRYFTDDWGIDANNYQIKYTHPINDNWTIDVKYRAYKQSQADFYKDLFLFESQGPKDYRARDKELSDFENQTIGIGLSYYFVTSFSSHIEKSKIGLQWDYIDFNYNNFSNLHDESAAVGEEELYSFDANVIKLYLSIWY